MNPQRRDLLAGKRQVWGDETQYCAACSNDAEPFSCYCRECEAEWESENERLDSE